jgi:dTDP-4-amino-4,6-dideoxygalactose transaminase
VVWCRHEDDAQELQTLLNYGFESGHDKPRDWSTRDPRGWRWNMSDVHAALNLEAVERLPDTKDAYQETWEKLQRAFREVRLGNRVIDNEMGIYNKYLFQLDLGLRYSVPVPRAIEAFKARGVATGWHFPPTRKVTLPCWPDMSQDVVNGVASAAREVFK